MERWREKANEMFPELALSFERVDSPYDLWVELWLAFEDAYDKTPPDESLIRRIYRYSDWCCEQPRGTTAADDLFTCVCVSFYELIPLRVDARSARRSEGRLNVGCLRLHSGVGRQAFEMDNLVDGAVPLSGCVFTSRLPWA